MSWFTKDNISCVQLIDEYNSLIKKLDKDDKEYFNKANKYHISNLVGMKKESYEMAKSDNIRIFRRYDDIFKITKTGSYNAPLTIVKLPIKQEIYIYGLYECINHT